MVNDVIDKPEKTLGLVCLFLGQVGDTVSYLSAYLNVFRLMHVSMHKSDYFLI